MQSFHIILEPFVSTNKPSETADFKNMLSMPKSRLKARAEVEAKF